MADRPVLQATVFSGREHCIEPVLDSLLALDYPVVGRYWVSTGQKPFDEYAKRGDLPHVEHIGGVFDRWEFLVSGTPLAQVQTPAIRIAALAHDVEAGAGYAIGAIDVRPVR